MWRSSGERLTLSLPSLRGGWESPLFASTGVSNGSMSPPPARRDAREQPVHAALCRVWLEAAALEGHGRQGGGVHGGSLRSLEGESRPRQRRRATSGCSVPTRRRSGRRRHCRMVRRRSWSIYERRWNRVRKQVGQQATLKAAITVAADAPGRAIVDMGGVHGALLRLEAGITTVTLDGAPRPLRLSRPLAA